MKQHAKLYEALPGSTRGNIEELIKFEAKKYADDQMRLGRRTLKGSSLAALIFVGVVTGGLVYFFIALGLAWWPGFIGAALSGILGLALIITGSFQLFDYGDEPASTEEEHAEENIDSVEEPVLATGRSRWPAGDS